MSNPYKVILSLRDTFEGLPVSVVPKATSPAEIAKRAEARRAGELFQPGRRAEHHGLLRITKTLKVIPITKLRSMREAMHGFGRALIGSGILGLFPNEAFGITENGKDARIGKPASIPDLSSCDEWDPSQRPTSNDLLDMIIAKLEAATTMAEKSIWHAGKDEEEIRKARIDLGRLETSIGFDMSCWQLADDLSYGPHYPSKFDTSHLVRERGVAMRKSSVALGREIQTVPEVRFIGQERNDFMNRMYNCGDAVLKGALVQTEPLVLAN